MGSLVPGGGLRVLGARCGGLGGWAPLAGPPRAGCDRRAPARLARDVRALRWLRGQELHSRGASNAAANSACDHCASERSRSLLIDARMFKWWTRVGCCSVGMPRVYQPGLRFVKVG